MKLFDSRRAPNPRRVRWVMAEKAVEDIEIVQVDIFKGEHRTPEYLAMAGLPNVPALLLDDGVCITESLAICRYLEAVYPEPNLFGHDPEETAVIEMWTRRSELLVGLPLMMTVRHTHPALAALETQEPKIAAVNRSAAERGVKVLDRRLQESPFIAGDRLTIADVVAFVSLDFGRMAQFSAPETLEAFNLWAAAMRQRPAASAGV